MNDLFGPLGIGLQVKADSVGVFLSVEDYMEISSFITFRLSSSGAFGEVNPELIITYPNGGQTLYTNSTYEILWSVGGSSSEKVDLYKKQCDEEAQHADEVAPLNNEETHHISIIKPEPKPYKGL